MKNFRNIVVFTTLFTILFTSYYIKADALAIDPATIAGLGDLGYGLFGGASFNFVDSKYVIDAQDLNETLAREKALEFLNDYMQYRNIGTEAFNLYDFYKTQNFDYNVRKIWSDYTLASPEEKDDALRFELSMPSLSSWMKNDLFWYRDYVASFENTNTDDIQPEVPELFSFLENINNLYVNEGVEIRNISNWQTFGDGTTWNWYNTYPNYDIGSTSLLIMNSNSEGYKFHLPNSSFNGQNILYVGYSSSEGSIYITTNQDNSVNVSYQNFNIIPFYQYWSNISPYWSNTYASRLRYGDPSTVQNNGIWYDHLQNTTYASLSLALNDIYDNFAFINLYVDGAAWILNSSTAPANPIIPNITDVINIESDEPAYDVVVPNIESGEGYFDLTSLLDRIIQAIIGASDTDDTTSGILDNTGIKVVDEEGTTVSTKDVPAVDAITAEHAQGDPDLPLIPLPPELKNAFKGTSILAELIDGTQTVLPEDLVTVFWGIISVIIIIGIIRVMHK